MTSTATDELALTKLLQQPEIAINSQKKGVKCLYLCTYVHSPGVPKEARLLNYYMTRLGGQVLLPSKNLLGLFGVSVSAALRSALALTSDSLCVETILLNCEHEGVCL